jgi:hypothetical protein
MDDYSRDEFTRSIYERIEQTEPEPFQDQGPKFSVNEEVLIAIDPRRAVKTEFPFVHGVIVRYLGRGTYLVADQQGKINKFNAKSIAQKPVAVIEPSDLHVNVYRPSGDHEISRSQSPPPPPVPPSPEVTLRRSNRNRQMPTRLIEEL